MLWAIKMVKKGVARCEIRLAEAYFDGLWVSVSPMREHLPVSRSDIFGEDAAGFGDDI